MRIETRKGHVMKLFAAIVAVAAAMAVVPALASGASRAPEKVSPEVTRPIVARPALVSALWRFEIVRGAGWKFEVARSPARIVAPVHKLQWMTAQHLALGSRLVLKTAR